MLAKPNESGSREPRPAAPSSRPIATVVIPTLDEGLNVDPLLTALFQATGERGLDVEVVVVDDGSRDDTRERVRSWEAKASVRLLARDREGGLSGAVLAGVAAARSDVVLVMDADLSHPVERVPDLIESVLDGSADVAVGSRYVPGGDTPGWPWRRRAVSRLSGFAARLVTDVRDPLAGFFAAKAETVLRFGRKSQGYKILLEVLAQGGEALRVREIPISFFDRERGTSKLDRRIALTYFSQLARLAGVVFLQGDRARTGAAVVAHALAGVAVAFTGGGVSEANAAGWAAGALAFAFFPGGGVRTAVSGARGWIAFLAAAGLAFGISGGVAGLASEVGLPAALAVFPAAAFAAATLLVGVASTARTGDGSTATASLRTFAIGSVLASLALRVLYAPLIQVIPEEAYYWNYGNGSHLDLGYLDHPPMVAWLTHLTTLIFGRNEIAVRLVALGCWGIALIAIFELTRRLVGGTAAIVAAMLLSTLPFFLGASFVTMPDSPLVACWAVALLALSHALLDGRSRAWWVVGACLGLGMLSKYPMALVGLAVAVFLVIDAPSRRWLRRPEPYLAVLLAAAIFSPVLIWNARHDWASFAFQTTGRLAQPKFNLHILILAAVYAVAPLGLVAAWAGLRRSNAADDRSAPALPARSRLFCAVFTLVPLSVFVVASLRVQSKINWTGPAFLAAVPAMALAIVGAAAAVRGGDSPGPVRWVRAMVRPTVGTVLVLFGVACHVLSLGVPGVGWITSWGAGWKPLAVSVDSLEGSIRNTTGEQPVVVGLGRYKLASELTFYDPDVRPGEPIASDNIVGGQGLMYEWWTPAGSMKGRTALLVAKDPADLADQRVARHFDRLEPMIELPVEHHGRSVGTWYARVGYGLRVAPQRPMRTQLP